MEVFVGWNFKPLAKGGWKTCAEEMSLLEAREWGAEQIIAIAIAGPVQPDDLSGHKGLVLHPCYGCRQMLLRSGLVQSYTKIHGLDTSSDDPRGLPHGFMDFSYILQLHQSANSY